MARGGRGTSRQVPCIRPPLQPANLDQQGRCDNWQEAVRHAWRSKSGSPAEAGAFQSVAVSHGAMEQQGPAQVREPAEAPVEEA